MERSSRNFSRPQAIENSRQLVCFPEQIFQRKQPLAAPEWSTFRGGPF